MESKMETKMNRMIQKEFEGKKLTAIYWKDEPVFIAKEVCDILDIINPSDFVKSLDKFEVVAISGSNLREFKNGIDSSYTLFSGVSSLLLLKESGFYKAVFKSRKPNAIAFQNWVTREVLPQIRKTGSYNSKPLSSLEIMKQSIDTLIAQDKRLLEVESDVSEIKEGFTQLPATIESEVTHRV
jgi:anti-repressor protein